jgi:anti-sigma regulatory factor (Ser/Thr protein kinase)
VIRCGPEAVVGGRDDRDAGTFANGVGGLDRSYAAELASVSEARRLLNGWLREQLVGQSRMIGDIAQAVSEACINAVVHAYRASDRPVNGQAFRLVAECDGTTVSVTVSDDGDGMTPRSDSPGLGLGLPLIATLSDDVEISSPSCGTGTVVAMRFSGDSGRCTDRARRAALRIADPEARSAGAATPPSIRARSG